MAGSQMYSLEPEYYAKFQCKGGVCEDTCCKGWNINFTRQDYVKLKNAKKPAEMQTMFLNYVKRVGEQSDTFFAQINFREDGKCPFLDAEGLCGLQRECGVGVLPEVCKRFPRLRYRLGDRVEQSCSSGCEAVTHILMGEKEGLKFVERPLAGQEKSDSQSATKFITLPVLPYYKEIRTLCIRILQNRAYTVEQRMILLGLALRELDELHRTNAWSEMPRWLSQKEPMIHGAQFAETINKLPPDAELSLSANAFLLQVVACGVNGGELKPVVDKICERINIHVELSAQGRCTPDSLGKYLLIRKNGATLQKYEVLFENLMVNYFFGFSLPFYNLADTSVWENYSSMCVIYSFYRFAVLCGLSGDNEDSEIEAAVTKISRRLMHNDAISRVIKVSSEVLEVNDLAHMVMLLKG